MKLSYPEKLPIFKHREEILDVLRSNQVVVVAGDTGSGKTTQLPKLCLEAFPSLNRIIGCTQPRRIAATTVALRVAEEMQQDGFPEDVVGYKIRFQDKTSSANRIQFMTDGLLLTETASDRNLEKYGVLIVDEAHERSLNIDFLLGYLKKLLPKRKDLKLIITSATIDTESFSQHFDNAPIINVSGRSYPIETRYLPVEAEDVSGAATDIIEHCVETVRSVCTADPQGDILIFLPTEKDIRECCRQLKQAIDWAEILPLFGRLPIHDQRKIFQRSKSLKIVVATNVAETSVTVPGIRYVIDSGLARVSRYNVRAKTTSLPVVRISKSSCDQRRGRCGRVGPGVCIRLYSEEDFKSRDAYTEPELQRSNLADVILKMVSLQLGNPLDFPFIDPPQKSAVNEGYRLLKELGALDAQKRLTKIGRKMASLPIDPCISRILLAAADTGCLEPTRIIAAALAIQDPRIRPSTREKEADLAHNAFAHPHSDFMTYLNIWDQYHQASEGRRGWGPLKKFCTNHYLSAQRMREWFDLHDQLLRLTQSFAKPTAENQRPDYEAIHKALLTGFARNISCRKDKHTYLGGGGKELAIFPGSHQFLRGGKWVVAATFLETGRLYALTVATIEPQWIEEVAGHLCNYSYHSPSWNKKSGRVTALENVTIFGLLIVANRRIDFGRRRRKNRPEARRIFITEALIGGELKGHYNFLEANTQLVENYREKEDRLRSRSLLIDPQHLYDFFDQRLPQDVFDQRSLNRWLKKQNSDKLLHLRPQDILLQQPDNRELLDYPLAITLHNIEIKLSYRFDPGSEEDGVSFHIPISSGAVMRPERFEWLVPGLLREKITFLLKSLPKRLRKRLVPLNEAVDRLLDDMEFGQGSLYKGMQNAIFKHYGFSIKQSDWEAELPPHLTPRFLLIDPATGKTVRKGRDLSQMLAGLESSAHDRYQAHIEDSIQSIIDKHKGKVYREWNFSGLEAPLTLVTPDGQGAGLLHPALVPTPDRTGVEVEFHTDTRYAEQILSKGLGLLFSLQFGSQYKKLRSYCKTSLTGPSAMHFLQLGQSRKDLVDGLIDYISFHLFGPFPSTIPARRDFEATCRHVQAAGFYRQGQKICDEFMALVRLRRSIHEKITNLFSKPIGNRRYPEEHRKMFQHRLDSIFPSDLLTQHTHIQLVDISRYLKALGIRIDRYENNPGKDAQKQLQITPHEEVLASAQIFDHIASFTSEKRQLLSTYQTLLNEFHLATFAPELGTRCKVSSKILAKAWRNFQESF